jgi:hypothetical protein
LTRKKILIAALILLCVLLSVAALRPWQPTGGSNPREDSPLSPPAATEDNSAQLDAARALAMEQAAACALQYDYDRALELLREPSIQNKEVEALAAEIGAQKSSLVLYEGDIKHIFFHSLIVYPEMIFKNRTKPMGGLNAGFAEKAELEKILPQLYQRGYVLYDLALCYEMRDGKMARKDIWLPAGKQPLVLSVDDVAYAYGNGFAQKMLVKDGVLVNIVKNPDGVLEEMPDGDVVGVVDAFVRQHPDFSYRGHKGTLAMTGYQGAFGFSFDIPEEREEIQKAAAALRADGWNFASHSYTHNREHYYGPESDPDNIKKDVSRWMETVDPLLGPTNLFIAPFGYRAKGQGLEHILDAGFQIYCTVSHKIVNEVHDRYALMSRIEIGGYSMTYLKPLLNEHFFNVDEVFDAEGRPPVLAG